MKMKQEIATRFLLANLALRKAIRRATLIMQRYSDNQEYHRLRSERRLVEIGIEGTGENL